jgi:hypothetical protein
MAVIGTLLPAVAEAGQIWLGGMDPVTTADRERVGIDPPGTYAANDFMVCSGRMRPGRELPR